VPVLTCINWHFVLLEVGTLVPEHDVHAPLIFALINDGYACDWSNERLLLYEKHGTDNFKKNHIDLLKMYLHGC
jgi:hypothetical protein